MDTLTLLDCALDDLAANGLNPKRPEIAGAFTGALMARLARGGELKTAIDAAVDDVLRLQTPAGDLDTREAKK